MACALIDLHTSRLLLLTLYVICVCWCSISVLTCITVSLCITAFSILLDIAACDVHKFGKDVRVFLFISTGFWMCQLYYNINRAKLWAVPVCDIKVIDNQEDVISIGVLTGGAPPPPEITSTSTTSDGTCNEETKSRRRKQR